MGDNLERAIKHLVEPCKVMQYVMNGLAGGSATKNNLVRLPLKSLNFNLKSL